MVGSGRVLVLGSFQCQDVLLIWMIMARWPSAVLAVRAGEDCFDILSLAYHYSLLFLSAWETGRYRLKMSLKAVEPKATNQPTNVL